jgi:plastocyanin
MFTLPTSLSSSVPSGRFGRFCAVMMAGLFSLTACGKAPDESAKTAPLPAAVPVQKTENAVTGRVLFKGAKPALCGQTIDVGGNPFCSQHGPLIQPAWRLSAEGSLADAVISVQQTQRANNLPAELPLIDQANCLFEPYVSAFQLGQSVRLRNSDLTFHNIRIIQHQLGSKAAGENLANLAQDARGAENLFTFTRPGIYRLECDIHRWMRAWVFVHDGIHVAKSDAEGRYHIDHALADGEYIVSAWHPEFPQLQQQSLRVTAGHGTADFTFFSEAAFTP